MKRSIVLLLVVAMVLSALPTLPVHAQGDSCGDAPPSQLIGEKHAMVAVGQTAPVFTTPSLASGSIGELGEAYYTEPIYLNDGPQCADGAWWWHISAGEFYDHWIPETVDGSAVLVPYRFVPEAPVALGVPMTQPVITSPEVPLPAVIPAGNPQVIAYAPWSWPVGSDPGQYQPPDPMALQLPDAYAGDWPVPPINLDEVYFVKDANLTPSQLAMLAQNGFVVVPAGLRQFDSVYRSESWLKSTGKGDFITTDALLHSLYLGYQNALMFLEMDEFYRSAANFLGGGYLAAEAQWIEASGTTLEIPARNAAVFYAVALSLLAQGEPYYVLGYDQQPGFSEGDIVPSSVLERANPDILALAQPMIDMALSAEGRLDVPILENYEEDFSQYKPRSYYAGSELLESYFRSMMWMGRITFRAKSTLDTQTGVLVMRALLATPEAYWHWSRMADTLAFLVGPMDDYSPVDYQPLAEQAFGPGLPLDAIADPARLDAFLSGVKQLPAPRVNSLPLPIGITADEVDEYTRGFRLFGQRFTLDGYIMQQLIYPEVGTAERSRALPLGLDVAAALGSDHAYTLAEQAGAAEFANYTENLAALRSEINGMSGDSWLENLYGGWLWALQPLVARDPGLDAPMMKTDAWKYKDIHTLLGSWTQLKHATLLYAEQPMGGLGGGGYEPPVISASVVEPNPLVFARIAILSHTLRKGLEDRGFFSNTNDGLSAVRTSLSWLSSMSARLAEIARREVAGEPVSYEDLYWLQEHFATDLWMIRFIIEEWIPDAPDTVALVADVASNASAGTVLEEAIGPVDYIYVVASGPHGPQLTRGGVYSYYEFVQPIDQRLTDDEWRAMVDAGTTPPRPAWTSLFLSE